MKTKISIAGKTSYPVLVFPPCPVKCLPCLPRRSFRSYRGEMRHMFHRGEAYLTGVEKSDKEFKRAQILSSP